MNPLRTALFSALATGMLAQAPAPPPAIRGAPTPQVAGLVAEMRRSFRAMIPLAGEPDAVNEVRTLSIPAGDPERAVPARLYVPKGAEPGKALPVILFMHGGGFVSGDLDTHEVLVRAMANRVGALVVSPDYRLAPEAPFPAGLEDTFACLQWISAHAPEIGGDPGRIAVSGDSAGGNLAAVVAILARDRRGPKLAAQWLMYPTVSNRMDTASWKELGDREFPSRAVNLGVIQAYVPQGTSPYAPLVAPLWATHQGLPQALIQVGERDPLRDEDVAYGKALSAAGVKAETRVYAGQHHGFIQFFKDKQGNPGGEAALDEGVRFLRAAFQRP